MINMTDSNRITLTSMVSGARTISNSLISAGYPLNWTSTNVERIGITDGNMRINGSKLFEFANMSYYSRKFVLGTTFDYYIVLKQRNGTLLNISSLTGLTKEDLSSEGGVGKPNVTLANLNTIEQPNHRISVSRYLIYNSEPVRMEIYLWQK